MRAFTRGTASESTRGSTQVTAVAGTGCDLSDAGLHAQSTFGCTGTAGAPMFMVEIRIPHEDRLGDETAAMRTWLDRQRIERATFRCIFRSPGALFRIDFTIRRAAVAFAAAFGGRVNAATATPVG